MPLGYVRHCLNNPMYLYSSRAVLDTKDNAQNEIEPWRCCCRSTHKTLARGYIVKHVSFQSSGIQTTERVNSKGSPLVEVRIAPPSSGNTAGRLKKVWCSTHRTLLSCTTCATLCLFDRLLVHARNRTRYYTISINSMNTTVISV